MGDTSQDQEFAGQHVSAFLRLSDVHLQYNWQGVWLRGLYAFGSLNDAEQVSRQLEEPIGSQFYGYYVEAAYDFMVPDAERAAAEARQPWPLPPHDRAPRPWNGFHLAVAPRVLADD